MMLRLARTSGDGTHTYRDRIGRDVAHAGSPPAVAGLAAAPAHTGWHAYGSPTQADGLVLLVRPDWTPEHVPIEPGVEGWVRLTADDLAELGTE
jgi:hypothetical protein